MNKNFILEKHIENFKKDENYIDFFREFALETININCKYVREVMMLLIKISREKKYKIAEHWCYIYLGWCDGIKGNIVEAMDYHLRAKIFFDENKIIKGQAAACNALLVDFQQMGYTDLALQSGIEGIKFSRKIFDNEIIVALSINMANVYIENKNYNEVKKLIENMELYNEDYRADYEIEINLVLARCNLGFGNLEKAMEHCEISLSIIKQNNFIIGKDNVLGIMGEILYKQGKHEKAKLYFTEAIEFAGKFKNEYMKKKILVKWAVCNFNINEYSETEKQLLMAIEELEEMDYISLRNKAYYYLSLIYEKKQEYKDAFEILKKYNESKEILNKNAFIWMEKLKERSKLYEARKYKDLYKKIERISNLGKKITTNLEFEKCINIIYGEIKELLPVDIFGVALYNEDKKYLDYKIFLKNKKKEFIMKLEEGKSLDAYCLYKRKDILINDITKEYSKYMYKWEIDLKILDTNSIIYIPMIINNEVVGIINIQNYKKGAYSPRDLNELKILAPYIAIALQNSKLFSKIKYLANYDMLTEVFNRNKILSMAEKCIELKNKAETKISIAMIDLDCFKNINDTYGHIAGDISLKQVAKTIKENLTSYDFVGRYGGEEFLILFHNKGKSEAYEICELIRKTLEEYEIIIDNNKVIKVTISIGVFEIEGNINLLNSIKKADEALYEAKRLGRNRGVIYS